MHKTLLLHFSCLILVAACGDTACPQGTVRAGSSCAPAGLTDAGPPHVDDDASSPDAAAAATCLVDQDHDGFGVEGAFGPCTGDDVQPGDCDDGNPQAFPGAPVDRCDHADNDCDGKDEPPIAEICNGLDDDCKDGVDNGVANACGLCGEVPTEICNNVDDDCDGVTDPNMREKLASGGEHVFTQAPIAALPYSGGQVALVPRKDGGAWFLYRGQADYQKEASAIRIVQLAKDGALAGTLASGKVTDGTSVFVAATDAQQQWVAIAERQRRSENGVVVDSSVWLRVQLFNAADMSLAGEYSIVAKEDDDSNANDNDDPDDCDDVSPVDVAVQQDASGDVYVAVLYEDRQGTKSALNCSDAAQTYVRVARRSTTTGKWSLPEAPAKLADFALHTGGAHIEAVPCRDEWLIVYNEGGFEPTWHVQRASVEGHFDTTDADTLEDVLYAAAIAPEHSDCGSDEAATVLVYVKARETAFSTHVRRWSSNIKTGTLSRAGEDVEVLSEGAADATALEIGGRWFVAGWTLRTERGTQTGRAFLRELSLDDSPAAEPSRPLELFTEGGPGGSPDANPGQTPTAAGIYPGQSALAPSEFGVIAAFPNTGDVVSTLDAHRENGATDPAVAVTYAIGCP
jgi:hypothetical protein